MNRSDLGELVESVDHAAVEQGEVAGVERDGHIRRGAEQAIERLVGDAHRQRRNPARSDAVDDVPAFEPLFVEVGNQLRRILEIAVEQDRRVAGRDLRPLVKAL